MNSLLDDMHLFQNGLVSRATGGSIDPSEYRRLRQIILENENLHKMAPAFIRRCQNEEQFWSWIKNQTAEITSGIWAARREIIWEAFSPLIEYLERPDNSPASEPIHLSIQNLDSKHVSGFWQKALARRRTDPAGAITAARTLLESTCKTILDECGAEYGTNPTLPALWQLTANELRLAPSQYQENAFKTILGNCQSIVGTLGNLRNEIGDAHGQGKNQ